jgi:hypothetical protein
VPLAGGIIFQMDQTAPSHQGVLRHQRERLETQIWIAISIYVLAAIARKRLGLEKSLYQILQIFSITSLEKVPILQVFEAFDFQSELLDNANQLILFDL